MKITAIASVLAITAGAASAADVSGEVSLDIVKNETTDKITATPAIDMSLAGAAGVGSIGLTVDGSDTVKLDSWALGTTAGAATVSFGDQGDLMEAFEGSTEAVGGQTLTDLDDDYVSLQAEVKGVSVLVGFTDINSDVSDVRNVQVGYGASFGNFSVASGVDWNMDTEDYALGLKASTTVGSFGVDGTLTHTEAATGYELSAGYGPIRGFLNGDTDDVAQNVGAGVYQDLNGVGFYAEAGYNIDSSEVTPAAGVSFKF